MKEIVIYTGLFGGYDNLIEPVSSFENCKFVCLTDQLNLKSSIWDIQYVNLDIYSDNMKNRFVKMNPHIYFSEYDISIYVDANVRLIKSPFCLIEKHLIKSSIAVPYHLRNCIYIEATECINQGKAQKAIVQSQMTHYKNDNYPANNGLYEMNIIIRKHNDKIIIDLMALWWEQINTWSQRDQLSFCYCAWKKNILVNEINENARIGSKYFFTECHSNDSIKNKLKRYLKKIIYYKGRVWKI